MTSDPYILGPRGRRVYLNHPDFELLPKSKLLDEIAFGLSRTFRFSGHTRQLYTVAQHCELVRQIRLINPLGSLIHDASEAYLNDIAKPLKAVLPDYQQIEDRFQKSIEAALGVDSGDYHSADLMAMIVEMDQLSFGSAAYFGEAQEVPEIYRLRAEPFLRYVWTPDEAYHGFLHAWSIAQLGGNAASYVDWGTIENPTVRSGVLVR